MLRLISAALRRLLATPSLRRPQTKNMAPSWLLYAAAAFLIITVTTRIRRHLRKKKVVAFLHPYAAQGGGGERVLWVAVAALRKARPDVRIVVYSGDGLSGKELVAHARERFGVAVPDVTIQNVRTRRLQTPRRGPSRRWRGRPSAR